MNPFLVYYVLEGVRGLGLGLIVTAPIYRIEMAGFGPLELVLAGTALEIAYFLSEVPTGVVADVYSRRRSCIIGGFVMGAAWLLEGSWASLWPIMAAQALLGVGWTFFSGASEAWIAGEVGDDAAAGAIVRAQQVNLIAVIGGGFVGAGLATMRLNIPILVAGASHIALSTFLLTSMPENGFVGGVHASRLTAITDGVRTGVRAIRGNRYLLVILVSLFFMGAASEGLDRLWEAHLFTDFRLPSLGGVPRLYWFAIVSGVAMALSVGALAISRRFVQRESDRALASVSLLMVVVVAVGCVLFGIATSIWFAIAAYWLVRIGRNVIDPALTVWAVRNTAPEARATVLSMHGQSHSVGEIVAGPTVGSVGRLVSIPAALMTSGAIEAVILPLLAREALRAPPFVPAAVDVPDIAPVPRPGAEPLSTDL